MLKTSFEAKSRWRLMKIKKKYKNMKDISNFINESWMTEPLTVIEDAINNSLVDVHDKEDLVEVTKAIEDAIENVAIRLEIDERTEVLKDFEAWAKKHKFNLN